MHFSILTVIFVWFDGLQLNKNGLTCCGNHYTFCSSFGAAHVNQDTVV